MTTSQANVSYRPPTGATTRALREGEHPQVAGRDDPDELLPALRRVGHRVRVRTPAVPEAWATRTLGASSTWRRVLDRLTDGRSDADKLR